MDIRIDSDTRNELLNRREIRFTAGFDGPTPSRQQIADKLAAKLNLDQKLMVVDQLTSRFGSLELSGVVRVYDTVEMRERLERPYLFARGKKQAAAEEGKQKAEAKK